MATNHLYFDLFDYIEAISNVDAAAQAAQGVAWKIDTMIVGATRQIYKLVRETIVEAGNGLDTAAEINTALCEAQAASHWFDASGAQNDGAFPQLRELLSFREKAHSMAAQLTALTVDWAGRPRHYETPDIDDLFLAPVNLKMRASTQARIKMVVDLDAEAYSLNNDAKQAMIKTVIDRERAKLESKSQALTEQGPVMLEIFRLIQQKAVRMEAVRFDMLDLDIQRALITHAITSVQRAREFALPNDNIAMIEFIALDACVRATVGELQRVLKSTKFVRGTAEQTGD